MPVRIESPMTRFKVVPNKPLYRSITYLQDFSPRRLQHPWITVCAGKTKECDFEHLINEYPRYYGTTFEAGLANDIDGNRSDDFGLTVRIPEEEVPKILFDASNVLLQDDDHKFLYYRVVIVLPNGYDRLPSTWSGVTIRKS